MADVSAIRALISDLSPGDITSLIAIFSYQGFNPEMVMKHLSEIKKTKAITDEKFKEDLVALICLGCIAGNYTGKNKDKRDEKGTAKADELFALYSLTMGSVGSNKRAVTLPRVLLTFPIMTHRVMMLCPERNFSGVFSTAQLPQTMKNAVFPSLIPSDFGPNSKTALLIAYCCYTCDQTKAINKDAKNKSAAELYEDQYAYVEIGHRSPEPPEADRKKEFLKIVIDIQANWPGIVGVLEKYKTLVNKSYTIPTKFGNMTTPPSASTSAPPQGSTSFD